MIKAKFQKCLDEFYMETVKWKLIILTFLFTNHFHSIQSMNSLIVNMLVKNINHYQIQSYSVEHFWYLKE